MKLAVIVPTFNSERTIERCLLSIISQKIFPFELIIMDGASSDRTVEIARALLKDCSFRWKIVSEKDRGISDAFNKGISLVESDWIHIIGSDDYYISENSISIIKERCQNISAKVIFFSAYLESEAGKGITRIPYLTVEGFGSGMTVIHPSTVVHADIYRRYGTFNEYFKIAMDFELLARIQRYSGPETFEISDQLIVGVGFGGESIKNRSRGYLEVLAAQILHMPPRPWIYTLQYYAKILFFCSAIGRILWPPIRWLRRARRV